jgi:hypothetical protein
MTKCTVCGGYSYNNRTCPFCGASAREVPATHESRPWLHKPVSKKANSRTWRSPKEAD